MKMVRNRSNFVMKVTVFLIIIGLITAALAIIFTHLYDNSYFAEKKFEELAKNYYENTLYEDFITDHDGEDIAEAFKKIPTGFRVKLRQILNSEFLNSNQNYRSYFDTKSYTCDTNTSNVVFKPHESYGKKDYDMEITLNCVKL
ncbi:hypothetical protein J6X90_04135 [Candidatus Saccharibacteria bacterium]|nr:hypothetical protein [Candidatus Saccharibacteria bacterium]